MRWPFVIGRKARLFSDVVAVAKVSAFIYLVPEKAKENGGETYKWLLRRVLRDLLAVKIVTTIEAM